MAEKSIYGVKLP